MIKQLILIKPLNMDLLFGIKGDYNQQLIQSKKFEITEIEGGFIVEKDGNKVFIPLHNIACVSYETIVKPIQSMEEINVITKEEDNQPTKKINKKVK